MEKVKDTIYRQDAIDAMWKIRRQLQMLDDTHKADRVMHGIYLAKKALEQLPSAQPEIIRCKDCKWFRRWIGTDIEFCDLTEATVFCDDFCSRAERWEE